MLLFADPDPDMFSEEFSGSHFKGFLQFGAPFRAAALFLLGARLPDWEACGLRLRAKVDGKMLLLSPTINISLTSGK